MTGETWYNSEEQNNNAAAYLRDTSGVSNQTELDTMSDSITPTKRCSRCKRDLPTSEFWKCKRSKDGLGFQCIDCVYSSQGKSRPQLIPLGMKRCSYCKNILSLDSFTIRRSARTGRHSTCRECQIIMRGSKKTPRIKIIDGEKMCRICLQSFPANSEYFYKTATGVGGLTCYCKVCWKSKGKDYHKANSQKIIQRVKEWSFSNPEKSKANKLKYRILHPETGVAISARRRARQRNLPATLTTDEWVSCLSYWNQCCCICGASADMFTMIVQEHWIPIADERADNPGTCAKNILPMCHAKKGGIGGCNNYKGDKDPIKWLMSKLGEKKGKAKLKEIERYFKSL